MPETRRRLNVFLCHASADKPKVRELYRYLRRRGVKPWFDEIDLVGGQDWQVEIPKALSTSDAIIICLTKNSVDTEGYVQKEIKFALDKALEMPEGRIFIIPLRLEECDVPFSLRRYQWVDLFSEVGSANLMRTLKVRASQLERTDVEISHPSLSPKHRDDDRSSVGSPEEATKAQEQADPQETPKHIADPGGKSRKRSRTLNMAIIVALIGFAGTIIGALINSPFFGIPTSSSPTSTLTYTGTPPPTATFISTETVFFVNAPYLDNMRAGPHLFHPIMFPACLQGTRTPDKTVILLGRDATSTWFLVRMAHVETCEGWLRLNWLEMHAIDRSGIRIVAITPTIPAR
jgi:hypothetical protein